MGGCASKKWDWVEMIGIQLGIISKFILPSGKRLRSYGKSPSSLGKSTVNGPFSIAMLVCQRVSKLYDDHDGYDYIIWDIWENDWLWLYHPDFPIEVGMIEVSSKGFMVFLVPAPCGFHSATPCHVESGANPWRNATTIITMFNQGKSTINGESMVV